MKYEVIWSRPGEKETLVCRDDLAVLVRRLRSALCINSTIIIHSLKEV